MVSEFEFLQAPGGITSRNTAWASEGFAIRENKKGVKTAEEREGHRFLRRSRS